MAVIDIGTPAVNFTNKTSAYWTHIVKNNPANATGKITQIEIWGTEYLTEVEVATFYEVSSNHLSTRDSVYLGTITVGSKQILTEDSEGNPISLDVVEGDYLGIYTGGKVEMETSGYAGLWYAATDTIPCINREMNSFANYTISLYGTGIAPTHNYFGYNSS